MKAVVAGWAAGYLMALITTATMAVWVARGGGSRLADRLGSDAPWIAVALAGSLGAVFAWTIVGLLVAIVYVAGGFGAEPGLGSPSWPFTVGVCAAALSTAPVLLAFPRALPVWLAHVAAFVGLFGWALPHLAGR